MLLKRRFVCIAGLLVFMMGLYTTGCKNETGDEENSGNDQELEEVNDMRVSEFELYRVPEEYLTECENKGKVETLTYHVESYAVEKKEGLANGSLYEEKRLYVYLPVNYTPEKQYNVLYLLHGSNETEDYWFYTQKNLSPYFRISEEIEDAQYRDNFTLNMLDHLFENGDNKEFIVVTPSFFSTIREEKQYGSARDDTMFWLDSFETELRNDIIPLVESKYSTYAGGDTSAAGIRNSRAHRAIAGFSRGSRFTTRIAVVNMLDVFGYFGSFHGLESVTAESLRKAVESNPDCPILYWYHGFGPKDAVTETQALFCKEAKEKLCDILKEGENFSAVEEPEAEHYYDVGLLDLYNFSRLVFQKGTV